MILHLFKILHFVIYSTQEIFATPTADIYCNNHTLDYELHYWGSNTRSLVIKNPDCALFLEHIIKTASQLIENENKKLVDIRILWGNVRSFEENATDISDSVKYFTVKETGLQEPPQLGEFFALTLEEINYKFNELKSFPKRYFKHCWESRMDERTI